MLKYLQIIACVLCLSSCTSLVPTRPSPPTCPAELPHYIEQSIAWSKSAQEQAILKGMKWLHRFAQKDANLDFVFDDYVLMMNELTQRKPGRPVAVAAEYILRDCFKRESSRLDRIFADDEDGKWRFLSIMSLLETWSIDKKPFAEFYRCHYQDQFDLDYSEDFEKALEHYDYDTLSTILIDTSFPYYYNRAHGKSDLQIPLTQFKSYLCQITDLDFIYTIDEPDDYSDQNYYATHVLFVAANYGEIKNVDLSRYKNVVDYIDKNFDTVRTKADDLDLLAEFVQCMKLCGRGSTGRVQSTIAEILSKQHSDGSWGTKTDFEGDPYDVFHPTWAVVTALNY